LKAFEKGFDYGVNLLASNPHSQELETVMLSED